ncbi:hypothetical protein J5TS2_40240 [Brevibacillus halotolerans]|nr:hypothetical protein J5TS2_40240 [Brevibacillus halotolerans]
MVGANRPNGQKNPSLSGKGHNFTRSRVPLFTWNEEDKTSLLNYGRVIWLINEGGNAELTFVPGKWDGCFLFCLKFGGVLHVRRKNTASGS